jgi:hypothetical protein
VASIGVTSIACVLLQLSADSLELLRTFLGGRWRLLCFICMHYQPSQRVDTGDLLYLALLLSTIVRISAWTLEL